jgi:flavin reductase (DIM6/NTAB) family NADH-FMN oxidoreductase RutF
VAFDAKRFKAACHQRAMNVAIIATEKPFKATLVTEHCAAFPFDDADECYVIVVIGSKGQTAKAISDNSYFSLSLLAFSQMGFARSIYAGNIPHLSFHQMHNIPYVAHANAAFLCSVDRTVPAASNLIVIGHVFRVIISDKPGKPLVNYLESYCSINNKRYPVRDPAISNPRLIE